MVGVKVPSIPSLDLSLSLLANQDHQDLLDHLAVLEYMYVHDWQPHINYCRLYFLFIMLLIVRAQRATLVIQVFKEMKEAP